MIDPLTLRGEQLNELRSPVADGLRDRGGQRCQSSGEDRVLRYSGFVVAHRHSFFAKPAG